MKKDRKVFDTESFIKECVLKFGNERFDYSKVNYVAAKKEVDIRCIKHDLWFSCQPYTHRIGKGGCPECHKDNMGQYHRLSLLSFVKRASLLHQYKYDYCHILSFKNAHEKVPIYCHEHGVFYQTVSNHLYNSYGCPTCTAIKRGQDGRISQQEFLERSIRQHGAKFDYTEALYSSYYEPVKLFCKEHKHFFLQKPADHFRAVGCKFCIDKGYSTRKPAWIYINKVGEDFIKVGITNVDPSVRVQVLNRKCKLPIVNIHTFYSEDGKFISDLEKTILKSMEFKVVPRSIMKSGYTETTYNHNYPLVLDMIVCSFNNYKKAT